MSIVAHPLRGICHRHRWHMPRISQAYATDYLSSIRAGAVGGKQKGDSPNDGAAPFIIDVSGKNYFFTKVNVVVPS